MVRKKKTEVIAELKSTGCSTKQIASMIYKDSSEEGQKKVRAILSKMNRKELELETGSKKHKLAEFLEFESMIISAINNKSLMSMIPTLRKRRTLASGVLWHVRLPVSMIAVMLYGDHGEGSQNKVYAHISRFRKMVREMRIEVAVANSTNKSCDLSIPTQPQNLNLKTATDCRIATIGEVKTIN